MTGTCDHIIHISNGDYAPACGSDAGGRCTVAGRTAAAVLAAAQGCTICPECDRLTQTRETTP